MKRAGSGSKPLHPTPSKTHLTILMTIQQMNLIYIIDMLPILTKWWPLFRISLYHHIDLLLLPQSLSLSELISFQLCSFLFTPGWILLFFIQRKLVSEIRSGNHQHFRQYSYRGNHLYDGEWFCPHLKDMTHPQPICWPTPAFVTRIMLITANEDVCYSAQFILIITLLQFKLSALICGQTTVIDCWLQKVDQLLDLFS